MGSSSESEKEYDYSLKILLLGDSGVGKSSVLASFISDEFKAIDVTIGMDLQIKLLTVGGKKLKLTIWDTAGQERYRSLPSSYYRGAQGIILVYDVTRRETFTNLVGVWANEMKLYSTNEKCVKIIVGNKIDKENERAVTTEEGIATAQINDCLFLECSAKTGVNVGKCFEQLASKILEVPSVLEEGKSNTQTLTQKEEGKPSGASSSGASSSGASSSGASASGGGSC